MNGPHLLRASPSRDHKENVCRLVVLGYPGVGKTALTVRFLTKRFIGEYCPTLESVYRYISTSVDEVIRLDILDTAGQLSTEWKDSYAMWGDCFIFVYSITDHASFDEVHRLRHQVEATKRSTSLCCALVGNKNDLVYERQVKVSQGQDLATELGCRFYELSASDWNQYPHVYSLFTDLHSCWRRSKTSRDSRQRKFSSSTKFKQAIQKVISGKSSPMK